MPLMLLPLLAFATWCAMWLALRPAEGWRAAFVRALISWAALATFFTEGLSFFTALTRTPLAVAWLFGSVVPLAILGPVLARGTRIPWKRLWLWDRCRSSTIIALMLGGLVLLVGIVAMLSSAITWDGMTYHLARVEQWRAHHSVAHFPTEIERQLYFGPCAEFAILQFQILGNGSDMFANCIQLIAWIGAAAAVSLLVRALSGDARAQVFGAAFMMTAPMTVLQASSVQNDLVCALFLAAFTWLALVELRQSSLQNCAWAAGSLALAIATKGTAIVIGAPFGLAWLCTAWRQRGWKAGIRIGAIVCAFVFLLNGPLWVRNLKLAGHPLGDRALVRSHQMEVFGWRPFVSNFVRHSATHFGAGSIHGAAFTARAVKSIHRRLDIDSNDRRTSFLGQPFLIKSYRHGEDVQGNFFHAWMFLFMALGTVTLAIRMRDRDAATRRFLAFSVCLFFAALLFVTMLKWQMWISRLHTPLFVLGSAPMALILQRMRLTNLPHFFRLRSGWLEVGLATLLIFQAVWIVRFTQDRNLSDVLRSAFSKTRAEQNFAVHTDWLPFYRDAVLVLKSLGPNPTVGIIIDSDDWEYPLWRLAREEGLNARFIHVGLDASSASSKLMANSLTDAVLIISSDAHPVHLARIPSGSIPEDFGLPKSHLIHDGPLIRIFVYNKAIQNAP